MLCKYQNWKIVVPTSKNQSQMCMVSSLFTIVPRKTDRTNPYQNQQTKRKENERALVQIVKNPNSRK